MNKNRINTSPEITIGSHNIFADLGLPNAEELLVKAQLSRQIYVCINDRQLTTSAAAEILGIDIQSVLSLIDGKLEKFSIEQLFKYLNSLDCDVEITIKPKPTSDRSAGIVVLNGR